MMIHRKLGCVCLVGQGMGTGRGTEGWGSTEGNDIRFQGAALPKDLAHSCLVVQIFKPDVPRHHAEGHARPSSC